MHYDPIPDIRQYYRAQIKELTRDIESTNRRDPILHRLRADRKILQAKLATLSHTTHQEPVGKMASYGTW